MNQFLFQILKFNVLSQVLRNATLKQRTKNWESVDRDNPLRSKIVPRVAMHMAALQLKMD